MPPPAACAVTLGGLTVRSHVSIAGRVARDGAAFDGQVAAVEDGAAQLRQAVAEGQVIEDDLDVATRKDRVVRRLVAFDPQDCAALDPKLALLRDGPVGCLQDGPHVDRPVAVQLGHVEPRVLDDHVAIRYEVARVLPRLYQHRVARARPIQGVLQVVETQVGEVGLAVGAHAQGSQAGLDCADVARRAAPTRRVEGPRDAALVHVWPAQSALVSGSP